MLPESFIEKFLEIGSVGAVTEDRVSRLSGEAPG